MSEKRLRRDGNCLSLILITLALLMSGCSIKRMAINSLGNALAEGTSVYARDDDPELIRDAVPFALKTVEGLLEQSPRHRGLLLSAASGFTQYAYAFLQCEADYIEDQDLARATEMRRRARKLYGRAMEYGLRGLEVTHRGFRTALRSDAPRALAVMKRTDVPFLYWTAAAWGAAISLAKEDAELTADLSLTEALMHRALELDERFGAGAVHDFFIAYEGGRPESAGGSVQVAREHLTRAQELSAHKRAAPLVSYAETVLVGIQDRVEFTRVLEDALAVDPDKDLDQRMANLVAQKRARWLLSCTDSLFIE
ncbi:MAG: hypothetical protein HYX75_10205 [Acidobacteria bacterium]|nr:hypothetical protein [Acidobacteriota bacterium]